MSAASTKGEISSESSISEGEGEGSPKLSSHTLAALQEFYSEQQAALLDKETQISEDWVSKKIFLAAVFFILVCCNPQQLSQFWYDEDTAAKLADEAIRVSLNKRSVHIGYTHFWVAGHSWSGGTF